MGGSLYGYEIDVAVPNDDYFNGLNKSDLSQILSDIVDKRRNFALRTIEGALKGYRDSTGSVLDDSTTGVSSALRDAEVEIYKLENATVSGLPKTAAKGSRLIRIKGKRILWNGSGRSVMRVSAATEEEGLDTGLGPFPCDWDETLVRRGAEGYLANRCINSGGADAGSSWRSLAKGSLKDASTGEPVKLLYLTLTRAPDASLDEYKSEEQIKSEPLEKYASKIGESLAPIISSEAFAGVEVEGMAVHDSQNGGGAQGHELIFDFGNITERSTDGGVKSGSVLVPVTIKKDSSGEAIVSEPVRPLFARDRRALPLFGASPKAIDFSDSYEGEFELPSSIKPGRYVVTIRGECHDPLREVAYIGPAMKPLDFKREKKPLKIMIKTKNTDGETRRLERPPGPKNLSVISRNALRTAE